MFTRHLRRVNRRSLMALAPWLVTASLIGYATAEPTSHQSVAAASSSPDVRGPRRLFVLFDGTANTSTSGTNVRRLFDRLDAIKDPSVLALYIPGVGTTESPSLNSSRFFGLAFGQGTEARIKEGYAYLAANYRPGDSIYLFGFSRGAHAARSLAGLVAHVGLPVGAAGLRSRSAGDWNVLVELAKKLDDTAFASFWESWRPGMEPPLAGQATKKTGLSFVAVTVAFLGLFDTVPGSSFKDYGICKEEPDRRKGDRYKLDTYPPIRSIAHAVARDEKRHLYRPLLVCPPKFPVDDALRTKVSELWFSGAHSDVGGGYRGSDQGLPNIALNWMIDRLNSSSEFQLRLEALPEDPNAVLHWSIGDMGAPLRWRIKCEDRNAVAGIAHHSVSARTSPQRIRVKGVDRLFANPVRCADDASLAKAPPAS